VPGRRLPRRAVHPCAALRRLTGGGRLDAGRQQGKGFPVPGYQVKHERIDVVGVASLQIRSLLDKQQFADPLGAAEALGISSAMWPLFGLLWPSGFHLAAALACRPVRADERILELGCGLALASLVAHRRGADITASDVHPLAESFLLENLRLNALPPLAYRLGDWGCDGPAESAAQARVDAGSTEGQRVQGRFELIIGSDVLYERDEQALLPQFIARHASATSEVLIVDPNRSNRAPFHRRMAAMGYAMNETLLEQIDLAGPPYRGRLFHYQRRVSPAVLPELGGSHGPN
jgi:predicted nicotinamide N-methyase